MSCVHSHYRGFTLIELMITVAIVALLASIAMPSYQQYILRTNRGEAKAVLLELAQFMERNYTEANRYDKNSGGSDVSLPVSQSPKTGAARYSISFATGSPTANAFTLTAVPQGNQTSDSCGTLSITNAGIQGASGVSSAADVSNCWQR